MAYEWPAFATDWGLHLRPFESLPFIVPKNNDVVRHWTKILTEQVDWPRNDGMSLGEALRYKMWVVRPFAQILMPLQHDYILFRRKTLETLQQIMAEQQTLQGVVATLTENDRWTQETIEDRKHALSNFAAEATCQLTNQNQQISRTEASVIQLEERIEVLEKRIYIQECKMKDKDETIALLVARNVPWEDIDPGATVPILERIQDAQRWVAARSRPVSPCSSRAPSPCPSDNC